MYRYKLQKQVKAATNIANSCIQLGGDWCRYNEMSGRMEYLDLEVSWSKEFSESWALYEQREQKEGEEPHADLASP